MDELNVPVELPVPAVAVASKPADSGVAPASALRSVRGASGREEGKLASISAREVSIKQ